MIIFRQKEFSKFDTLDKIFQTAHGSGRKLSRTAAINTLDLEKEIERLDSLGIVHSVRSKSDLEESTGAYKDIDEVMELQKDLVDPVMRLRPIAVIKGS